MSQISFKSVLSTQDFLVNLPSRKLLLFHNPINRHPEPAVTAVSPVSDHTSNNLSGNALMILSVLICGIICSLGLHYIIRCVFKCSSRFMISEPVANAGSTSGSANKGVKQEALKKFPVLSYSPGMNKPGLGEECVICLSEFQPGESLRILPSCNHGFHVPCIDKWLKSHASCPKCRHCLVETSQRSVKHDQTGLAIQTAPEIMIITLPPLEPERRMNIIHQENN